MLFTRNSEIRYFPKLKYCCWLIIAIYSLFAINVRASNKAQKTLFDLSLEQILDLSVESASGFKEAKRDAPSAIIVITQNMIKKRGYTSLKQVMWDLPGFDISDSNGVVFNAYQRGYRTPSNQRTLMLVNGKVENGLWNHRTMLRYQFPMNAIDRIEILYGPASAIYGPNAFLGVINIITHDLSKIDSSTTNVELSAGSFNSQALSLSSTGKIDNSLRYHFALKHYLSDGPRLDDYKSTWGYSTIDWLSNRQAWGPILDQTLNGKHYGQYFSPLDHQGLLFELQYHQTTFGYYRFSMEEGFAQKYAFDHAQPNVDWLNKRTKYFIENKLNPSDVLSIKSLIEMRETSVSGNWVEATPDWNLGMSNYSFVSNSDWNSENESLLLKQDYHYQFDPNTMLSGGIKFESKRLTKAYHICGYWSSSLCIVEDPNDLGPSELGSGIFHSSEEDYIIQPSTRVMPSSNKITTLDKGIYFQIKKNLDFTRINFGLRYDKNNIYGSTINPRISAAFNLSQKTTLKLLYGKAFQEPAPQQLFGGWSGRRANPNLKPEKVENKEIILMYPTEYILHDLSFYQADYSNVVKEEADNAGSREVLGFEYRATLSFPNFIDHPKNIEGYFFYSYIDPTSELTYNHDSQLWVNQESTLGDIAKHKVHFGLNIPISDKWSSNIRVRYIGKRPLYSRNPLSSENINIPSFSVTDLFIKRKFEYFDMGVTINNLFDKAYFHPGQEAANSGNQFNQRASGFANSLLPQVARNAELVFTWNFD